MTKGTKTLLYVLGGLAVVGGGTAAIIYATKKPETAGASGGNTVVPNPGPGQGSNPTPAPGSVLQTTVPEINGLLSLAQAIAALQPGGINPNPSPGL